MNMVRSQWPVELRKDHTMSRKAQFSVQVRSLTEIAPHTCQVRASSVPEPSHSGTTTSIFFAMEGDAPGFPIPSIGQELLITIENHDTGETPE